MALRAGARPRDLCVRDFAHQLCAIGIAYSVSRVRAGTRALGVKKSFFPKSCLILLYLCTGNRKNTAMTGLGLLATGAAYLNFKQAKADYDALVEKRDGLLAAVQTFNSEKDKKYIEQLEAELALNEVEFPDGVQCTAILRTAYLVGDVFRCVASVILTNLSDKTYQIGTVAADCFIMLPTKSTNYADYGKTVITKVPVLVYKIENTSNKRQLEQETNANITLHPNETIEIALPKGISAVPDMAALRQMVCDACGKKLITSCPKVSIENGIKADILYKWHESGEEKWHTAKAAQKSGVFRYCMELPLNANS